MPQSIAWPPKARRRARVVILAGLAVLAAAVLGGGTAVSYYVDAVWFASLGYAPVFWTTLTLQWAAFTAFAALTFLVLYGSFLALKPAHFADVAGGRSILIGGQRLTLPVEPILQLIALIVSLVIAGLTGAGMMSAWPSLALYWYAPRAAVGVVDPIFGRALPFYLFTLPAWQLVAGWLTTLAVVAWLVAIGFAVLGGGVRALGVRRHTDSPSLRGLSTTSAFLLLLIAEIGRAHV